MRRFPGLLTGCLAVVLSAAAWAGQVRLDVSMANPTLLAEKKQTTFVKVGLTGFPAPNKSARAPVNVAIALDKSGSMNGEKIEKAKEAAIAAVNRLGPQDLLSVVVYDSNVRVLVPATKLADRQYVIDRIREIHAGGQTALFGGVSKAAEEVRKFLDRERVNRVLLLSDGLANVGPQSPSELGSLGASLMKEGISVSTVGLGLDYNEDLMTQLAMKGGGNHVFIEKATDLVAIFNREFDDVLSAVAQEVSIEIRVASGIRPIRSLNMDAEINGQQVIVQMSQIYSRQEKYVMLELEVPPGKPGESRAVADVSVSYANLVTKTTDRLTSAIRVNFSDSQAECDKKVNKEVAVACALQVAACQNKLATDLRDKGDTEGARQLLLKNSEFLRDKAAAYGSAALDERGKDNAYQAGKLGDADWSKSRKIMRGLQYSDTQQQSFEGTKR